VLSSFLKAQTTRPPLWVRVNHPDKTDHVVHTLCQEGYVVQNVEGALSVSGERGIFLSDVYKQGLIEIQDFASQKAGASVQARPGDVVWDACAGGGGKTLQIASRLQNKGAVYASDVREFKLEEVKKRARRAGFFNVRCEPWDGVALPSFPREVEKRGGFDWVLVDAPCSSSGTWRRNPDAKYRIGESSVAEISALQKSILSNAARAVGAKGNLVYSTCSWLVDENEDVVRAFLSENPSFHLLEMRLLGSPCANSDTLFSAVLARRP
jgi:16S rRNA (cytosine967-C5)-methyltransferase